MATDRPLRIAFVTPRYGPGVVGGSEAVMAEAAHGLGERGYEIELLTTCARSHFSWSNEFEAGTTVDRAITIRRFPTVSARSRLVAGELERRVQRSENLSEAEEVAWVNGRFRVPDLYLYLVTHAKSYDAIILSPYLFWSTIYGAEVAPERTIVMPCLHDESYAWLKIVAKTLSSAAALWFLSEPEHQLGHRVAPGMSAHHRVVGAAVEVPSSYDPVGFCDRYGLTRPFILYAGRREDGKGWRQLLAGYAAALVGNDLPFDLVTVGVGSPNVPEGIASRVIDLGFMEAEELPNAFAAAEAMIQPSVNESFSRTMMESWLAGTPVIANAQGEVITWHCERSGGGLTYNDDLEFAQCLRFIAEAPKAVGELARRGRDYVLTNYTWEIVLDAMEHSLHDLAPEPFTVKTLVVGTTPPPGGMGARALAVVVGERMLAGDVVEVLSPDVRSAAHHTGNLSTLFLPLRLAIMAPRFDALILRIEPGLPLGSETGRFLRGATLFGLGIVAGMFSEVTLRLDSPIALPGGVGGRATIDLWRRATHIVVANEADERRILEAPGVTADRVVIAPPLSVDGSTHEHPWPEPGEDGLREQVLSQIRKRVQAERQANTARVDLGVTGVGPLTSEAFSASSRVRPSLLSIVQAVATRVVRKVLTASPTTR